VDVMNDPILRMGSDKMVPRYAITVTLPDRGEWNLDMVPLKKEKRGSSVSTVSDYGLVFDPRQRQRIFLLVSASRPALGPTQPPVQRVPGALSPGGTARPGRDADHSPPFSAEVRKE
jgi:hypothetical protein